MNIQTAVPSGWKSVTLAQTKKLDRENGSRVSPDREVFHINSKYQPTTRTIPGTTRYEDNIADVWERSLPPQAGDAVIALRAEGREGVKRTGIGLGIGLAAGTLASFLINPSSGFVTAGALIGGVVGAGIGFHKFDGFNREDFRCQSPLQAFTLANNVERLAHQVAAQKA